MSEVNPNYVNSPYEEVGFVACSHHTTAQEVRRRKQQLTEKLGVKLKSKVYRDGRYRIYQA